MSNDHPGRKEQSDKNNSGVIVWAARGGAPGSKQKGHTFQNEKMSRKEAQMLAAEAESEPVALPQKGGSK
jgi:hypothetical protein